MLPPGPDGYQPREGRAEAKHVSQKSSIEYREGRTRFIIEKIGHDASDLKPGPPPRLPIFRFAKRFEAIFESPAMATSPQRRVRKGMGVLIAVVCSRSPAAPRPPTLQSPPPLCFFAKNQSRESLSRPVMQRQNGRDSPRMSASGVVHCMVVVWSPGFGLPRFLARHRS